MNRAQAYKLAQAELLKVEQEGFAVASGNIGPGNARETRDSNGTVYEVELSYTYGNTERSRIEVTCKVTPKNWFRHEQLEESITLYAPAI